MNYILQEEDSVMFIKFLRVSWNCYGERMQKRRMSKQVARAAMEVTRRREKPQKKQRDEVELDLKFMGIKYMNSKTVGKERKL
jgi:hypothetical protein